MNFQMHPALKNTPIIRYTFILFFIFLFFAGLYYARRFLIPVFFAGLFAMLFLPVCEKLEHKGASRWLAVLTCLLLLLSGASALVYFIASEVAAFVNDIPNIQSQISQGAEQLQRFIARKTGLQTSQLFSGSGSGSAPGSDLSITSYLDSVAKFVKNLVSGMIGALIYLIIVCVYFFLMLYYRLRFKNFILKLTPDESKDKAREIVSKTSKVTYNYLTGKLVVVAIIAVINSVGLSLIGVKHAIFFGVLAAFLDFIPYIGVAIGAGLPLLTALTSGSSWGTILAIAGLFTFVQFLENYYLTPHVVGSHVKLNPLFTLMITLIGGYLWGIAGLILFIPLLGIIRVVFDHIDRLHPYAYLIRHPQQDQ